MYLTNFLNIYSKQVVNNFGDCVSPSLTPFFLVESSHFFMEFSCCRAVSKGLYIFQQLYVGSPTFCLLSACMTVDVLAGYMLFHNV